MKTRRDIANDLGITYRGLCNLIMTGRIKLPIPKGVGQCNTYYYDEDEVAKYVAGEPLKISNRVYLKRHKPIKGLDRSLVSDFLTKPR